MDTEQYINMTFEKLYEKHQNISLLKFKRKNQCKSLSRYILKEIDSNFSKRPNSLPLSYTVNHIQENLNYNSTHHSRFQIHTLQNGHKETSFIQPGIFTTTSGYADDNENFGTPVASTYTNSHLPRDGNENFGTPVASSNSHLLRDDSGYNCGLGLPKCQIEENLSKEVCAASGSLKHNISLDENNFVDCTFELLYKSQQLIEGLKFKRKRKNTRIQSSDINKSISESLTEDYNQESANFCARLHSKCEGDSDTDSNKSGIIPVKHRKFIKSPEKQSTRNEEFKLKQRHSLARKDSLKNSDKHKRRRYHTSLHKRTQNEEHLKNRHRLKEYTGRHNENEKQGYHNLSNEKIRKCSHDKSMTIKEKSKYLGHKGERHYRRRSEISKFKSDADYLRGHDGKVTKSQKYYKERHKLKRRKPNGHERSRSQDKIRKIKIKSDCKRSDIIDKASVDFDYDKNLNMHQSSKQTEKIKLNRKICENLETCENSKIKKSVYRNYHRDKQMKTRGMTKYIIEKQKRKKELTSMDQKMQEEILQKHELVIGHSSNGYDCLDILDERVNIICDDEISLENSSATKWSNGERQYNLTISNQSEKVLHNGGIWKSITRERF